MRYMNCREEITVTPRKGLQSVLLVRVEDQDMYVYGEKNYTDCGEEITLPARNGLQDVLLVRIEDSGDTYYIWTDAGVGNRMDVSRGEVLLMASEQDDTVMWRGELGFGVVSVKAEKKLGQSARDVQNGLFVMDTFLYGGSSGKRSFGALDSELTQTRPVFTTGTNVFKIRY